VCHAGEEGPPAYIWQALTILHAQRIDHGNACVKDPELITYLAEHHIPLTMCPFSNVALHVIESLHDHPAKYLLEKGVCVSIHSDDPAYFGGYIDDNLKALARALSLTRDDIVQLLRNSFTASFLPHEKKKALLDELEEYIRSW